MFPTTFLTTVGPSAVREHDLGALAWYKHATYGWQQYRYIYAVAALTAGGVAMHNTGTAPNAYDATPAVNGAETPAVKVLGVAQEAIAITYYGWVQIAGRGIFKACDTGTDQLGVALVHDGSGSGANADGVDIAATDGSQDDLIIGYGLEAASGSAGDTFAGRICVPV